MIERRRTRPSSIALLAGRATPTGLRERAKIMRAAEGKKFSDNGSCAAHLESAATELERITAALEKVNQLESDLRKNEYVTVKFNKGHELRIEWRENEQCIRIRSLYGTLTLRPNATNEILVS